MAHLCIPWVLTRRDPGSGISPHKTQCKYHHDWGVWYLEAHACSRRVRDDSTQPVAAVTGVPRALAAGDATNRTVATRDIVDISMSDSVDVADVSITDSVNNEQLFGASGAADASTSSQTVGRQESFTPMDTSSDSALQAKAIEEPDQYLYAATAST